jgi:hypothetical protein
MRQKLVNLAKQAAKLLWIELVVPGGTLVVLAILVARGLPFGKSSRLTAPFPAHFTGERSGSDNQFSSAEALQRVP